MSPHHVCHDDQKADHQNDPLRRGVRGRASGLKDRQTPGAPPERGAANYLTWPVPRFPQIKETRR